MSFNAALAGMSTGGAWPRAVDMQPSCEAVALHLVAVKELKLSYYGDETLLFNYLLDTHIMVT